MRGCLRQIVNVIAWAVGIAFTLITIAVFVSSTTERKPAQDIAAATTSALTPASSVEPMTLNRAVAVTATFTATLPTFPIAQLPPQTATETLALMVTAPTTPSPTVIITKAPTATPIATQTPSTTPTKTPMPTATQVAGPTINRAANLRAGPGTDYAVVGGAVAGEAVTIVGQNAAGDWVQLASGAWIARFLVDNLPGTLAIVEAPPTASPTVSAGAPTAVAVAPTAVPPTAVPPMPTANQNHDGSAGAGQPFTCNGGCAEPPPGSTCTIKGNVNPSKDTRIYHAPGGRYYDKTDIKPEEGDRWFCNPTEAEAAGFRAAQS